MNDYYRLLDLKRSDDYRTLNNVLSERLKTWRSHLKEGPLEEKALCRQQIKLCYAAKYAFSSPFDKVYYDYQLDMVQRPETCNELYSENYIDQVFLKSIKTYYQCDEGMAAVTLLKDEWEKGRLKPETLTIGQMVIYQHRISDLLVLGLDHEGIDRGLWLNTLKALYKEANDFRRSNKGLLVNYDHTWLTDVKKDIKKLAPRSLSRKGHLALLCGSLISILDDFSIFETAFFHDLSMVVMGMCFMYLLMDYKQRVRPK